VDGTNLWCKLCGDIFNEGYAAGERAGKQVSDDAWAAFRAGERACEAASKTDKPKPPEGRKDDWRSLLNLLKEHGVTMRESPISRPWAAVALKVPKSGYRWLNELIQESRWNELAAMAMRGLVARAGSDPTDYVRIGRMAYEIADAMLAKSGEEFADGKAEDS
jgi:hypothetical protein